MSNFEKIKRYYMMGIYKKKHIDKFLSVNAITQEEYNIIINSL